MSEIITRYGGWVNKFLGDGILIIFGLDGAPGAVERAAEAALEMDRVIDKYPWRTRIGIATGPFVIGEFGSEHLRRFDCIGHTMNLGSRLQGLADSGQTLVCDQTYEKLSKKNYGFSPARMVYAKGIGEILAYPLIAPPPTKRRDPTRASRAQRRSA
jgi:class 3 adenylate cyclase